MPLKIRRSTKLPDRSAPRKAPKIPKKDLEASKQALRIYRDLLGVNLEVDIPSDVKKGA